MRGKRRLELLPSPRRTSSFTTVLNINDLNDELLLQESSVLAAKTRSDGTPPPTPPHCRRQLPPSCAQPTHPPAPLTRSASQIFSHLGTLPAVRVEEEEAYLETVSLPWKTLETMDPHPGLRGYPFLAQARCQTTGKTD